MSWRRLLLLLLAAALVALLASRWPRAGATAVPPDDAGAAPVHQADAAAPVATPSRDADADAGTARGPFCLSPGDSPMARLPDPVPAYVREALLRLGSRAERVPGEDDPLRPFLQQAPELEGEVAARLRRWPRRRQQGVDLYARAMAWRAWPLLVRGRDEWPRALAFANEAVAADDVDPVALAARALVLERLGRASEARADLRHAFEREPLDPHLALGLARRLERSGDVAEALAALTTYRAVATPTPAEDEAAARFEAQLETEAALTRDDARRTSRGVTVVWPERAIPGAAAEEIADGVAEALDEAARLTSTTRRAELTAVVYANRDEYQSVTCAPAWSVARYDGTLRLYYEPDRQFRRSTWRHEATHAQLDSAVSGAPLWFSEGLADYVGFAGVAGRDRPLDLLARSRTWIPFSSLNGSLSSFDTPDSSLAYAQSDAMVLFLMEEGGPDAIPRAARYLAGGGDPTNLLDATLGRAVRERELLVFVERRVGQGRPAPGPADGDGP